MKVTFEGREYESLDAMPPDARERYEQAMRAFTPGAAGGGTPAAAPGALGDVVRHAQGITINGRHYASADQMPDADRALYEAAIRSLAAGGGKVNFNVRVRRGGGAGRDVGERRLGVLVRFLVIALTIVVVWLAFRMRAGAH